MNKPRLLKVIKDLLEADYPYSQSRIIGDARKIAKRIKNILDKECQSPAQARLRDSQLRKESEYLEMVLYRYDKRIIKDKNAKVNVVEIVTSQGSEWKISSTIQEWASGDVWNTKFTL